MSTSTLPLARTYRPRTWDGPTGLVGQSHVVSILTNAIRTGSIASAYLFAGPRGTGKTTSARVLAAALNCETRPDGVSPCGVCASCIAILDGKEAPDVVEIDAATNRGADDARELRSRARYAPMTEHGYKVYILDEAHMLTREAWNALLKILEEPPPRVCFVFCTTEPHKIEQTAEPVLSRCQRIDMRRLTQTDITGALKRISEIEDISVDAEAIALIARRADGGMRDALSLLDQLRAFAGDKTISTDSVREVTGLLPETMYLSALDFIAKGQRDRLFKMVSYLETQGVDAARVLDDFQEVMAALAILQEGGMPEGWSPAGLQGLLQRAGRTLVDGKWVQSNPPAMSTRLLVALMRRAQEDALLIRSSPRPFQIVSVWLQDAVSRTNSTV